MSITTFDTAGTREATAVSSRERLELDNAALEAAKRSLEKGAVTPSYGPWREDIIKLLNDALATEIVCTLRYKRHYFTAKGLASPKIAEEFLVHANEETAHGDMIAERIVQLGGEPDFAPTTLTSAQPRRLRRVARPAGDDPRQPDRRARRHRGVRPDDQADRRQGFDDPAHARIDPEPGAGARRRAERLAHAMAALRTRRRRGSPSPRRLLAAAGCAETRGKESTAPTSTTTSITTTVKARLVEDKSVDADAIKVETANGNVVLSGVAQDARSRRAPPKASR